MFSRRSVTIATKHSKEQVIAPLLIDALGLAASVASVDTDLLGTFSGEIERKQGMLETARLKCDMGREQTGADLVIASEGSFGPHPYLGFAAMNEEKVLLKDYKNGLEIVGEAYSTFTNFSGMEIRSKKEMEDFASRVEFPEHSLIIKDSQNSHRQVFKGIQSYIVLNSHADKYLINSESFWLETDMRANHNPKRMKVIEQATRNLIDKMGSVCPRCSTPGFWKVNFISGLECLRCASPTKSIKAEIYACEHCDYAETKEFPNNKTKEDPMYCDYCNP